MTFLAEHHERLNQQEPRWIVITLVRIASTAFLCLAVLMFSLCLSWLSGVQWVWESQPVRAETAYYLFMGGLVVSFLVNAVYFIPLLCKAHYLLHPGFNIAFECLVWTIVLSLGLVASFIHSHESSGVYCTEEFQDSRQSYAWCVENWDRVKWVERAGMVFYWACGILHFGLFVQACRRVHVRRKANGRFRKALGMVGTATDEKQPNMI